MTFNEAWDELPQGIQERLKKAVDHQYGETSEERWLGLKGVANNYHPQRWDFDNPGNLINKAITWDQSPEGYDYWRQVASFFGEVC